MATSPGPTNAATCGRDEFAAFVPHDLLPDVCCCVAAWCVRGLGQADSSQFKRKAKLFHLCVVCGTAPAAGPLANHKLLHSGLATHAHGGY